MRHWTCVILAVAALFVAFPASAAEREIFVLNMACLFPEDHPVSKEVLLPWAKELQELTGNQIHIRLHQPDRLIRPEKMLSAIQVGQLDMGHGENAYTHRQLIINTALMLSTALNNPVTASEAYWRVYNEIPEARQEFANIKILALHSLGRFHLAGTNKDLRSLEDMQDKHILVYNGIAEKQASLLGATAHVLPLQVFSPSSVSYADAYYLPVCLQQYTGLDSRTKNVTVTELGYTGCWLGMHQGVWDSLPQNIQKAITQSAGLKLSLALGRAVFEVEKSELERLRIMGIRVNYLSHEENARWKNAVGEKLLGNWLSEMRLHKITNPRALYDRIMKIASEAEAKKN